MPHEGRQGLRTRQLRCRDLMVEGVPSSLRVYVDGLGVAQTTRTAPSCCGNAEMVEGVPSFLIAYVDGPSVAHTEKTASAVRLVQVQ